MKDVTDSTPIMSDSFLRRMPEETLDRALLYLSKGYSAMQTARICDINLAHARLLKLSNMKPRK